MHLKAKLLLIFIVTLITSCTLIPLKKDTQQPSIVTNKLRHTPIKEQKQLVNSPTINRSLPILQIDSQGHQSNISKIIFTHFGNQLISASTDKTIRVWDIKTGTLLRTIRGQIGRGGKGKIHAMALSSNDSLLAVGGVFDNSAEIRLIDFKTGKMIKVLSGDGVVFSLDFSPNNQLLLSGSSDKTATLWNINKGSILARLKGHKNRINEVAFSPDGQRIVTASNDHTLRLWSTSNGKLLKVMKGHSDKVYTAEFMPDGSYLLSGGNDKSIRLWNGKTGNFIKVLAKQGRVVSSLSINSDGSTFVTGAGLGKDFLINNVFAIPSGKIITRFIEHDEAVRATAFSPKGNLVATAESGGKHIIYLWDSKTGNVKQSIKSLGHSMMNVGFANQKIAWGKNIDQLNYSLFNKGPLTHQFNLKQRKKQFLNPNINWLRGRSRVGSISIRTPDNKPHRILLIKKNGKATHAITLSTPSGDYHIIHKSLTLTPDAKLAITGGSNGYLASISTQTGKIIHEFKGHTSDIQGVASSADGRLLISGSADQTIRLWDIHTGKNLLSFFHGKDDEWVAWTPEGFYDASPNGDKYVGWHVNRGADKAADYYHANQFRRYLYRPDIIANTIQYRSSAKAIKLAGMEDITIADLVERAPADIQITSIKESTVGKAKVSIKIGENNANAPERITLFVNGAQQLAESSRQLNGVNPGDVLTYTINTFDKENQIKVLVENKWAENSARAYYTNTNWKAKYTNKGTLYITAIGIKDYPKLPANQQLSSPGLDARHIASKFKKLKAKLYDKVVVKLLTNKNQQQITSEKISNALKQQAAKTTAKDTSLIFLAGHGVTDKLGDYHFVTADSEISSVTGQGISIKQDSSFDWNKLHSALDQMLGRRMVIVDTCQAGEVLSDSKTDIKKLVKEVHDVNAIIYSGTSRQQSGMETEHGGIFTNTLIEGINGKAHYDNQQLKFASLKEYVNQAVPLANLAIVQRGLKRVKEGKEQTQSTMKALTQNPIAVIPEDMKELVIYQK